MDFFRIIRTDNIVSNINDANLRGLSNRSTRAFQAIPTFRSKQLSLLPFQMPRVLDNPKGDRFFQNIEHQYDSTAAIKRSQNTGQCARSPEKLDRGISGNRIEYDEQTADTVTFCNLIEP